MKAIKKIIDWFTKPRKTSNHYSVSFDSTVVMNDLPVNEEDIVFYKMKVRSNIIVEITSITNKTKKSNIREVSYRELNTGKEGKMDEDIFYHNFEKVTTPKPDYKNIFLQKQSLNYK